MLFIAVVFIFFNVLGNISCHDTKLNCGANEIVDECPATCQSEFCPKHEGDGKACEVPTTCPPAACKCRVNTRRADNGTCIPTTECPPFDCTARPHEEYDPCPPYCPTDSCTQATLDGSCPLFGHILILRICNPACRCTKGYWRHEGVCIPYNECPNIKKMNDVIEKSFI